MILKPVNNRVLIKYILKNKNNISNILLPENIIERSNQGIVIEISKKNSIVKIGDHIVFNKYSGENINFNNEDFLIIKEEDILCIINK